MIAPISKTHLRVRNVARTASLLGSLTEIRGGGAINDAFSKDGLVDPCLADWASDTSLGQDAVKAGKIWDSLTSDSSVIVYGDYDVDGISSTALLVELASAKCARVRWYIPHRNKQGYGLHTDVVAKIAESGTRCDLLAVVDCGTHSADAVRAAREHGIPVIVFDHHLARGETAPADALVNPQIDGDDISRHLCAAGVVWLWAWQCETAPREWLEARLDLPALATVADCVSLASPLNRAIVRAGIDVIRSFPRPGLRALARELGITADMIDSDTLAMKVIPCINAAGRLGSAEAAMKLFFPTDRIEAHAETLVELNRARRDLSVKMIEDIERGVASDGRYEHVLYGSDWPAGVLSSVASQLCSRRCSPVVLAAPTSADIVRGTLRVPQGVDAEAILSAVSDRLVSWGGHRMAAGFSVERKLWSDVRDTLEESLASVRPEPEMLDVIAWEPCHLTLSEWKDASRIGPFGVGNPYPLLYCTGGPTSYEPLGRDGAHVKAVVDGVDLLAFGGASLQRLDRQPIGWIYKPRVNWWRQTESLQFVVERYVTE